MLRRAAPLMLILLIAFLAAGCIGGGGDEQGQTTTPTTTPDSTAAPTTMAPTTAAPTTAAPTAAPTTAPPEPADPDEGIGAAWPMVRHDATGSAATDVEAPMRPGIIWTVDVGRYTPVPPVVTYGRVYHIQSAQNPDTGFWFDSLVCRDSTTGDEQWSVAFPSLVGPSAVPCVSGGLVLVNTRGAGFLAYDAFTGEQVWRTSVMQGPGEQFSAPVAHDGMVYLALTGVDGGGAVTGRVSCHDLETGAPQWERQLGDCPVGAPAIGNGNAYIVTRAESAERLTITALNASTGRTAWTATVVVDRGGAIMTVDAPLLSGTHVYVPYYYIESMGDHILAVKCYDAQTGAPSWSYESRARYTSDEYLFYEQGGATLSGTDLHVLAPYRPSQRADIITRCYLLDAQTGEERVVTTLDAELFFPRRTAAQLLAVSQAGTSLRVHGLDARTGQQVWTFSVRSDTSAGGTGGGQAAITDGYIFLRLGNTLYCLG